MLVLTVKRDLLIYMKVAKSKLMIKQTILTLK